MKINWTSAFNHLFVVLNREGDTYFSGPRFFKMLHQVTHEFPDYQKYIEQRRLKSKSTTRKQYFFDIIESLTEAEKKALFKNFIESLKPYARDEMNELESFIHGGGSPVPVTDISTDFSGVERLTRSLNNIDSAIESGQHSRAVTLSYSCLEGIYKAYLTKNMTLQAPPNDLLAMAKLVKNDILDKVKDGSQAPEQIINSIPTITNAIANSRNGFSESHFDQDAKIWLATYTRDLTNSIGRLLTHFM